MSREIRFRAWDGNRMREVYKIIMGKIVCFTDTKENTPGCLVLKDERLRLMQFTGLHDKNGKELYEGDVVKWGMHKGSEETYHRYAVVEINPDIQFRILFYVDGKTGEKRPTDNYVFRYGQFGYKTNKHLEIIGNQFENPELLK